MPVPNFYYTRHQRSSIRLAADDREVTDEPLHTYIPEFEDDFFDEAVEGKARGKNYIIKTYVLGEYLNTNVSLVRGDFQFSKKEEHKDQVDYVFPFSQQEIERKAAEVTKDVFSDDVKLRMDKKRKRFLQKN